MEESNVQPVRCPVTVCGDIHGQFVRFLAMVEFSFHILTGTTISMIYQSYFESGEIHQIQTICSWATMLIEDITRWRL